MSASGTLFRPYSRLVTISVLGREVQVPENNMLLRCFQYLAATDVAMGRFCWNEECQHCRICYDLGENTPTHQALACKLMVREGLRVNELSLELRYCLRSLDLPPSEDDPTSK